MKLTAPKWSKTTIEDPTLFSRLRLFKFPQTMDTQHFQLFQFQAEISLLESIMKTNPKPFDTVKPAPIGSFLVGAFCEHFF